MTKFSRVFGDMATPEAARWEWTEAMVTSENWHQERDRLTRLLRGIEAGALTQFGRDSLLQGQMASPADMAVLKKRLAQLNDRLGDDPR